MFCDVFSVPPGVYVGTLISSIPGPSIFFSIHWLKDHK